MDLSVIFLIIIIFYLVLTLTIFTNFMYSLHKIGLFLKKDYTPNIKFYIIKHYTNWLGFKHWFVKLDFSENIERHNRWYVNLDSDEEYKKYSDFH